MNCGRCGAEVMPDDTHLCTALAFESRVKELEGQIQDLKDRVATYQKALETPKKEILRQRDDAMREVTVLKRAVKYLEAENNK